MPGTAAVITTLILERPMCIPCIAGKAFTSPTKVETALADIATVANIRRESSSRCRGCGEAGIVFSLVRRLDDD